MADAPETFRGRGVWYFDGTMPCPLAGVGTRDSHASNRLVLEDDRPVATLDRGRRRIDVVTRGPYPEKARVVDVTLLGDAITARGTRTPIAIHLEVYRQGSDWKIDLHRHLRVPDKLVDVEVDFYTVTVDAGDGAGPTTMLDRQTVIDLVKKPSVMHRVIKAMMAMKDHAAKAPGDLTRPGFAVADLEMGFGVPPLAKMLVRAKLTSLVPAAELAGARSATELLTRGGWELELTALADKYMAAIIQRDLMLFGIEDVPLLAPVKAHGLARGQRLAFRFQGGDGSIHLDDAQAPLPGALDVARAYLEYHMLGGLLAEHAERFARRLPAR